MKHATFGYHITASIELPNKINFEIVGLDELIDLSPDFDLDNCEVDYIQLYDDEIEEEAEFIL